MSTRFHIPFDGSVVVPSADAGDETKSGGNVARSPVPAKHSEAIGNCDHSLSSVVSVNGTVRT